MTKEVEALSATHSKRKKGKDIMTNQPFVAEKMIGDFAPKLAELTDTVLYGDIWERPGLSKRDRSLITVATLVALYRTDELPFHLGRALENGVSKDELIELITHLAFYAGWPTSITAIRLAKDVFAKTE
jgi:4-carboxymuconolactone decarboxylase